MGSDCLPGKPVVNLSRRLCQESYLLSTQFLLLKTSPEHTVWACCWWTASGISTCTERTFIRDFKFHFAPGRTARIKQLQSLNYFLNFHPGVNNKRLSLQLKIVWERVVTKVKITSLHVLIQEQDYDRKIPTGVFGKRVNLVLRLIGLGLLYIESKCLQCGFVWLYNALE